MNCCINCFTSSYLVSIISGGNRVGNCDYCKTLNVSVYSARELLPFFRNILSLYHVDKDSKNGISDLLISDFNILLLFKLFFQRFIKFKVGFVFCV